MHIQNYLFFVSSSILKFMFLAALEKAKKNVFNFFFFTKRSISHYYLWKLKKAKKEANIL